MGTRDETSMRAWAKGATTATLKACRVAAEEEYDWALVGVINKELYRRGEEER
jgi:hypothetical protein